MPRSILLILFLLSTSIANAQQYKFSGKITNTSLEPLAFVSVQIKETQLGTKTDTKGNYKFQLAKGEYELVYSMVGYKTQTIKLVLLKGGTVQNIVLEESSKQINEVVIGAKKKDKAEEYIRHVIEQKQANFLKAKTFSCDVYIKATQENEFLKKNKKKKTNTKNLSDSAKNALAQEMNKMSMTEISLRLDVDQPSKIKEERTGVKKRGETESLFYLSTTEGNFSLYQNLIKVPALSVTPMLSPISYSGLVAYKYKTIKTEKRNGYTLYTIKYSPTKLGNALIEGTVTIIDTSWTILDANYTFPTFHMVEYNSFEVTQSYEYINNKAWLMDRQELSYMSKSGRNKQSGNTLVLYKNYNTDTTFPKNYFGVELSNTSLEAYERDSSFWNTVRQEPLTEKEIKYIRYKDSIYYATHTQAYFDSVDKRTNKITIQKILYKGQEFCKRSNERTLSIFPAYTMYRPFAPGGARLGQGISYSINPKSRKNIIASIEASIGLVNPSVQGTFNFWRRYNAYHRGYYFVTLGRRFEIVNFNDAFINLFKRNNYFVKESVSLGTGREFINGLYVNIEGEVALRKPLNIVRSNPFADSLFAPFGDSTNSFLRFSPYNVSYIQLRIQYTPFQMYMREPRQKVVLGSNYPTFYVQWRKGIPNLFSSVVNFDYIEAGLFQKLKLGLAGISQYSFKTGKFINKEKLNFIDYKFMRRGDPLLFSNPTRNFQNLDSTFPVFNAFYEGHYLHEFNGSLINKIPLVKKLNLLEVAGGGILYTKERNLKYIEAFVGIEKIVRLWQEQFKFGLYYVTSAANTFSNPIQFKVGIEQFDKRRNSW
jgi:hypothetical protein